MNQTALILLSRMPKDMAIGKQFGKLTICGCTVNSRNRIMIECKCVCGNSKLMRPERLRIGKYAACKNCSDYRKVHGLARRKKKHPLYGVWLTMKNRCENPNCSSYHNYGGRGIDVCQRWRDSFESFISDMGERPSGLTIERKNNSLGYSPENCEWADRTAQRKNSRDPRTSKLITYNGRTMIPSKWAHEFGLAPNQVNYRLRLGWSIERILSTPIRERDQLISFKNESKKISEWAEKVGIKPGTLRKRFKLGWTVKQALTTAAR